MAPEGSFSSMISGFESQPVSRARRRRWHLPVRLRSTPQRRRPARRLHRCAQARFTLTWPARRSPFTIAVRRERRHHAQRERQQDARAYPATADLSPFSRWHPICRAAAAARRRAIRTCYTTSTFSSADGRPSASAGSSKNGGLPASARGSTPRDLHCLFFPSAGRRNDPTSDFDLFIRTLSAPAITGRLTG